MLWDISSNDKCSQAMYHVRIHQDGERIALLEIKRCVGSPHGRNYTGDTNQN
jgi:hypothetical protein